MTDVAHAYLDALCERLTALKTSAADSMGAAVDAIVETVGRDGLV